MRRVLVAVDSGVTWDNCGDHVVILLLFLRLFVFFIESDQITYELFF